MVAVLAVATAWLWWPRGGEEAPAAEPAVIVTPTIVTPAESSATRTPEPAATPTPTATATPEPTPEPAVTATTAAAAPGTTVLFHGGPARGPWQQIGSVAEITHPGAPPSARYSYDNFWADPAEENQSAELWDQLVAEVAAQAVLLGPPADRPVMGGAEGSEPFNASGGMQDVYRTDGAFSASWSITWLQDGVAVRTYFPYLISFEGEVIARGEEISVPENAAESVSRRGELAVRRIRQFASSLGYEVAR